MFPRFQLRRQTIIIGFVALGLVVAGAWLNAFELLELKAIDAAFVLRGTHPPTSSIVIVAIDDESFTQTGLQWPWHRAYLARVVDRLAQAQPRVIAVDVLFFEPAEGDAILADAIRRAGNVVLANTLTVVADPAYRSEQLNQPVDALARAASAVGLSNFPRDADGYVRRVLAFQEFDGRAHYHWIAQTAALYLGETLPGAPTRDQLNLRTRAIPLQNQSLLVNYRGSARAFQTISAYQVVNGEVSPARLHDKIILIGATTESLHDTYPTPFQGDRVPMPGVEIGANAIATILDGNYLTRWELGGRLGTVIVLGLIGLALNMVRRPALALLLFVAVALAYAAIWFGAFSMNGIEMPVIAPQAALAFAFLAPAVERAVVEEAEKRRVRHIFEQFIPPEMVEQIVARGIEASRGRRAELTILFSDIRGFTSLSEQMPPDQVVNLLNEYLEVMTGVIFRHGGTLDKFEGDAILAFWGAPHADPDHARHALLAALEMRVQLDRLRKKWAANSKAEKFEIGIGVNTGEVFVGLIGSTRRVSYTVIGDHVNLAARLQDLTKEYQWPLLISEQTFRKIQDEFDAEFIAPRTLRGKSYPVRVYKVLGRKNAPANERVRPLYE